MLRRIQHILLIDRPLFYALAARVWQAISGPITISLIIAYLSASETGVYYSLAAIVGIQVFFDLGLSNLLISQAGFAVSSVSHQEASLVESGTAGKNPRLSELIRFSEQWFLGASVLFGLVAYLLGRRTLGNVDITLDWKPILFWLILFNAISFSLIPSQAILEGAGRRELIYRFRLFQAICGSITVWVSLSLGFKLWSLVASALMQALWMAYLRFVDQATFFAKGTREGSSKTDFSWLRDIVPVQWRLAVMSIAFFLATQFLVLIILYYESESAAGQLGITLSIVSAIQMFALAWLQTNFSTAAIQHGSGNREAAGTRWRKLACISSAMLAGALASFVVILALLPLLNRGFENRFVTPGQLAIFSIGCLANHLISAQTYYVLSQCARPLTRAATLGFAATSIAVWLGGWAYGISGLVIGYSVAMSIIVLPLHTWAYLEFRQSPRMSIQNESSS